MPTPLKSGDAREEKKLARAWRETARIKGRLFVLIRAIRGQKIVSFGFYRGSMVSVEQRHATQTGRRIGRLNGITGNQQSVQLLGCPFASVEPWFEVIENVTNLFQPRKKEKILPANNANQRE